MKHVFAVLCICLIVAPTKVLACAFHMELDPNQFGSFGGAIVRMAGLAPPEPVFNLEHPRMAKTMVGERSEVTVNYSRPSLSKNVRLQVEGTSNVQLLVEEIALEATDGTVTIPFQATGSGFDYIKLTVSGEHEGDMVSESKQIFVRASRRPPSQGLRVSEASAD